MESLLLCGPRSADSGSSGGGHAAAATYTLVTARAPARALRQQPCKPLSSVGRDRPPSYTR